MKKAITVLVIVFIFTVLAPLIAMFNINSNDTNQEQISTQPQESTTYTNELVTIFDNPTS